MNLEKHVRTVYDFPHAGIIYRDITPLLEEPNLLHETMDAMAAKIQDLEFDLVVGPESRGFIFGVPLALMLDKGFVAVRKAGKLPGKTVSKTYDLEYGSATIEINEGAIKPGQKVIIVDDLIATGGTTKAVCDLVEEMGGEVVRTLFLIELVGLNGAAVLKPHVVESVIKY